MKKMHSLKTFFVYIVKVFHHEELESQESGHLDAPRAMGDTSHKRKETQQGIPGITGSKWFILKIIHE